jgi:hypothetical protein
VKNNGDEESPGKESEKDHQEEISSAAMGYLMIHLFHAMNLSTTKTDLRGFVFLFASPNP